MSAPALRVRFEIPRAELERAEVIARREGSGFNTFARAAKFDEGHMRGRVLFDVNVPFVPDPILAFLKEKRGLRADPPVTVSVAQPVPYAVGQLASAGVMALHGEGGFTLPLVGGRGAITVGQEADAVAFSVPLESYAGAFMVPRADAAHALSAAASSLAAILRTSEALSAWSFVTFLEREARILESAGDGGWPADRPGEDVLWPVDDFAEGDERDLAHLAADAENAGAHVVPYWRARRLTASGSVAFEPIRVAGTARFRGALARGIFPGSDVAIQAALAGGGGGSARLRERLKRPRPFTLHLARGGGLRIEEPGGALPMA